MSSGQEVGLARQRGKGIPCGDSAFKCSVGRVGRGYDHSRRFVLARTLVRPASQEVGIAGISLGITRGLDVSSRDRGDNKESRSLRKFMSPQTC